MAGGCPYLVCLLALVSPDDCFLSGDPCHFDATPVGSAFSGHSEVDLTTNPTCRSGRVEWHYTYPYLSVTFGGGGLPYTACIRPTYVDDGYQFYQVKDGQETPIHGPSQEQWWCQKSDHTGNHVTIKVKPKSTYYMDVFDFRLQ